MHKEPKHRTRTLSSLQAAFKRWRKKRTKREHLPAELLDRALGLVGQHSLSGIAKTLGLNYTLLKQKAEERRGKKTHPTPSFIEIPLKTSGLSPLAPGGPQCLLEIETPQGVKARFYKQEALTLPLHESLKMFFGQGQ